MAKKSNKPKQEKKEIIVKIRKLKSNYELRYDYYPLLTEFIKRLPKEHRGVRVNNIVTPEGETKDDWIRIIREVEMGKIITFLIDNSIKFIFENLTPDVIERLRNEYLEKQRVMAEALKAKADSLDVSQENYSFMNKLPYEYQKKAIKFFEINKGLAILGDQPGVGKSQNLDSLIATPEGWVRMGDIKIGQKIFHHNGNSYKVTGIFPQGKKQTYKVIFNDGFSSECSIDHLWMVRDVNRRKRNTGWIVKTLKELNDYGLKYNHNENRTLSGRKPVLKWEIPIIKPCNYPDKYFIIHPYILGALIGDGCLGSGCVSISVPDFQVGIKDMIEVLIPTNLKINKKKISKNFPNACPQYFIIRNSKTRKNLFKTELERLKLCVKSGQKFIPKEYLFSGYEQRLELLRGLMDTDGSALKNRINYHTTSHQLSNDVSELVQSLGGQAIINVYNREKEGKSTEFRVNVRLNVCPFNLKEKVKKWKVAKRNYASRYIESIVPTIYEEHQCIAVDSPDNTYITNNYIVTHNTCPAFAYATKNKFKTLILCPSALKFMWRDAIHDFTNDKSFIFNYQPKKKNNDVPNVKTGSMFHIINYELLESYIKLEYKHKCSGQMVKDASGSATKRCGWEQTDLTKKYKQCPVCQNTGTITSRIHNLVLIGDKFNNFLDATDYDLIIIDECHRIKNEKTTWTKIVKKAFRDIIPRKILLSGTPVKNRPFEFYSLLNFLFPAEFNSSHDFGVRYCAGHQTNFGWDYSGASNLDELVERISSFFLRRLKKDVLKELPPKTFTDILVEMTDVEEREYNKIEKAVIKELVDGVEIEKEMTHLGRMHKLFNFTAKIKLKRAIDYIQDIIDADEKIVIFSEYIDVARAVKEHFGDVCVIHTGEEEAFDKHQAVESFQKNKKIKIFSGTIMSAGVGITLTAANKLIFLGSGWSPADNEQCEDRIHRATTTADNVQIIKFLVMNTVDIDREELLKNKSQVMSKVVDNKDFKKDVNVSSENVAKDFIKKFLSKK